MTVIIGVSGKLGSGKDYVTTNVIVPVLMKCCKRYIHLNVADQIKVNVMTKHKVAYCDVYEKKTLESRRMLQSEGTEIGRASDEHIWVKYLDNWIMVHNQRGIDVFVISDIRFQNEFEYVKSNGSSIMIKVVAQQRNMNRLLDESNGNVEDLEGIKCHRSECDLDGVIDSMYDLVINNDTGDTGDTGDIVDIKELQNAFERILRSCC